MDYTVPSLFQVNVYSLEIFAQYSADYDSVKAFLLSLPLLLAAVPAIILLYRLFRNAAVPNTRISKARPPDLELPVCMLLLQSASLLVLLLQFMVPVLSLLLAVGVPRKLADAVGSSWRELGFTLQLSCQTAILAVLSGALAACAAVRKGLLFKACYIFILLPFAIPAPLVGVAVAKVSVLAGAGGANGFMWMPVLTGVIRFLPFSALIMLAVVKRIDPGLLDAAKVQQNSMLHGLLHVTVPMLSKGLAAAGCLVFILSTGELGASLIVTPPGTGTITMKIYNYLHYGASDTVAALCLIMLILSVAAGAAVFAAITGQGADAGKRG